MAISRVSDVEEARTPLLAADALRNEYRRDTAAAIEFNPKGDPENPLEFSTSYKWGIVAMLAYSSFTVTFNCISIAPVARQVVNDLEGDDGERSLTILLVTIWELGEAIGPFLIAPLSEIFGRYPVMNACNLLFTMMTACVALAQNTKLLITLRALTGLMIASNVLNPAIVGDLFVPDERGKALSLVMFATVVGGAVGPAFGGIVTDRLGWRAVPWMGVILTGVGQLMYLFYFRETYKISILRSRIARFEKKTRKSFATSALTKNMGLEKDSLNLRTSIIRPAAVFCSSGVLATLSLFGSSIFAYLYVVAVTLPNILEDIYGLSPSAVGSAFLVNPIGSFTSVVITNMFLDKIYIKCRQANNGIGLPEFRLPITIIGAFMLPPGVVLYGWCAAYKLPLALFLFSVIWIRLSLMLATVPLMAYVVDAFNIYAASALTGVIVTRCLVGVLLPLATTAIIDHLGYGWGFTMFGAVSLALAIIPVLVIRYGSYWRQRSKYTRSKLES